MSAFYKIGEFADKLGVSIQTLRNWDKEGKLKPAKVTDGGTRYYSEEQYISYSGLSTNIEKYALACSINNMSLLEQYMASKGYKYKVVCNVFDAIPLIESNEVDRIVFYCKEDITINGVEKLTPSAFKLFETMCNCHGVAIDIVRR